MTPRLRALVLSSLMAVGTCALAAQRALLVGVSELVNQPSSMWLQAPRNDVLSMRKALLAQGFAAGDITMLADGVSGAGLPEAQRIHAALGQLLAQSRSGDFVLLYFSGHGTRLRDANKRYDEPDGLAENFLARDVRGADANGVLPGGVRDVDFDAWIGAFLARNVFVWSVFDTCSAASMTRSIGRLDASGNEPSDNDVRFRGVRSSLLSLRAPAAAPPAAGPVAIPAPGNVPRARYVAFFASESHQVTPELRLPRNDRSAQPQGLLTWAVTESMKRKPATWRDLFDGVLAAYPPVVDELRTLFPDRELPSPVAEGNLDLPVFTNSQLPLSTRPVWRARRTGASLALDVGEVDGLESRQEVRVLATRANGMLKSAPAVLRFVDRGSARLDVPAPLAALSDAVQWTVSPLEEPRNAVLRVAAERSLPEGLALAYPSAVRHVQEGEGEADVRWVELPGGGHRIDVLSPVLAAVFGSATPGGMAIADVPALRSQLQSLAQLKWLLRVDGLAEGSELAGFDAVLETWRGGRLVRSGPAQGGARLDPPAAGERTVLRVRNTSGSSVDLVVIGVDAQGALRPVFPIDAGETNRFERGTAEAPAAKSFPLDWLGQGGAHLLVLAAPAAPYSAPRLFGASLAPARSEVRVRGLLQPTRARPMYVAMVGWAAAASPPR